MRRVFLSLLVVCLLAVPAAAPAQKPAKAGKVPAAPAPAPAPAATLPDGGPVIPDAKAWILIDARDGTQITGKGSDKQLPIASTTKLMTAYLALQNLKPKELLTAPKYQATDAESLLGLRVGEKMSVRDLLFALILESANDAAETFAVGISGSVEKFVAEMNTAAQALGLTHTHYSTPVGLDASGNYSSARDLVTLADKLLENPLFAKAADSATATLKTGDRPRQIGTRNLLIPAYPFVTGVKTGHTLDAGYVLVGSGEKNGTTLISAVLGTPSEGARDADTLKLLNYGFAQYKPSTPVEAKQTFDGPDLDYGRGSIGVEAEKAIQVSARTGQKVDTEVDLPAEIKGGVDVGQKIGEVRVTVDGREAGSSPLLASESAGPASIFRKAFHALTGPLLLIPVGLIVIVAGFFLAGGRKPEEPKKPEPGTRRKRQEAFDGASRGKGPVEPAVPPRRLPPRPQGDAGAAAAAAPSQPEPPPARPERQRKGKSPRTAEDRERMRKERMERRSRNRAPEDGR